MVHVGEAGLSTATDRAILDRAGRELRTVVTLDADFHALLALSGASGPSVIRLRVEGLKAPELAGLLERVLARIQSQLDAGAVATVSARSVRVRRLPIPNVQASAPKTAG